MSNLPIAVRRKDGATEELILVESGGLDEAANSWPNDWHEAYIRQESSLQSLQLISDMGRALVYCTWRGVYPPSTVISIELLLNNCT